MSGVRKREYGNRTDQEEWGIKEGAKPEMLTNEKILMVATLSMWKGTNIFSEYAD